MQPLECSICLDVFGNSIKHAKAPKILKCGHTFCKECLQDLIKRYEENFFLCPKCNTNIIKEKDIEDYITNIQTIELINLYFSASDQGDCGVYGIIPKKFIVLGDSGVGKSCILKRLLSDKFENSTSTVGIDSFFYYVIYQNIKYNLIFYDTAGQEKYKTLTKTYLKGVDGVIFVFDVSNIDTFNSIKNWYKLFLNENEKVIGVLLGNKSDITEEYRKVEREDAELLAKKLELKYFETSALTDKYIKKAIVSLLNSIIEEKSMILKKSDSSRIKINKKKSKKKCC